MTVHLNTQADLEDAIHALVQQDPRLQPILKLTGMPALRRRDPGYAGLAAIVCGQQLSTASAAAIWARLTAAFDPFHHDTLRRVRANRLGRLGLSAAKIKTLKSLAREIAAERLDLEVLANEEADAAHDALTALHGIGPWTADVYLLFCLGHGDAWPAGDLAVQEAVKIGLGLKTRPTAKEMAPLAEPWRPLRGAAAHLWWSYYRVLKKREGVIGTTGTRQPKANAVLNRISVAKRSSVKAKITAAKLPGSKKWNPPTSSLPVTICSNANSSRHNCPT
jgi:DNA-3-methyladenine glycosylase II